MDDESLKLNLGQELLALISAKPHYAQARILSLEKKGKEIIRAERQDERVLLVDEKLLQLKGDRDYFRETIQLPEDSIYVSAINLNQEYGKIIFPMVPTLRVATPLFDGSKKWGILIINVDLSYVFKELSKIAGSSNQLRVLNQQGYYLIHPDTSQVFRFEFGKDPNLDMNDFETRLIRLNPTDSNFQKFIDKDKLESVIRFDFPRKNYTLYFNLVSNQADLLATFNAWKSNIISITLLFTLMSIAIAVYWTRRQSITFRTITNSIANFGRNPDKVQLDIQRDDEIGDLIQSFVEMAAKINRNLEDLKQARDEAHEANKAKQLFLDNMSHEIRNPLQSILGMVEMLQQNKPRIDQQVFLDTLKFSGENLLTLVNDILDYRKLLHGQIHLVKEDLPVSAFLDRIVKSHLFEARTKKIKLELDLDPALLNKSFYTDRGRLSQILNNLITNAIRFSKENSSVLLIVRQIQGNTLEFLISDKGPGISDENIENILKQKPVTGSSKQLQNVGLGLPIVINLLKLFGSELKIQSEIHKGSTFQFTLECKLNEIGTYTPEQQINYSFPAMYIQHVACIEDDPQTLFFYKQLFDRLGIHMTAFNNPGEFMNRLSVHFELILSDLNFMHNDSPTEWNQIEKIRPKGSLFLIVSGADDIGQDKLIDSRFWDGYLQKPVSSEQLIEEICQLIFKNHFEAISFDALYQLYDFEPRKMRTSIELLRSEWKDLSQQLIQSASQRRLADYDKAFHRLINSLRIFGLHALQHLLEKVRNQLALDSTDAASLSDIIAFPLNCYIEAIEKEALKNTSV